MAKLTNKNSSKDKTSKLNLAIWRKNASVESLCQISGVRKSSAKHSLNPVCFRFQNQKSNITDKLWEQDCFSQRHVTIFNSRLMIGIKKVIALS